MFPQPFDWTLERQSLAQRSYFEAVMDDYSMANCLSGSAAPSKS